MQLCRVESNQKRGRQKKKNEARGDTRGGGRLALQKNLGNAGVSGGVVSTHRKHGGSSFCEVMENIRCKELQDGAHWQKHVQYFGRKPRGDRVCALKRG